MRLWLVVLLCHMVVCLFNQRAWADASLPTFALGDIIGIAVERNPLVAGALAAIDQSTGQRTAAGAYPNPTVRGDGGKGYLRDAGSLRDDIPTSANEYMAGFSQPFEWPAKRAARQRAAEAGLAGASVGLVETRLNLTADVKVAFYDLLLAQRDLDLAKNNLTIVEDVRRIVGVRVRLGEAPQFELIKAEVEVLKANQAVTRAENTVRVNRVILDTFTAGALGPAYAVSGDFSVFPAGLDLGQLASRSMHEHPSIQRLARSIDQADRTVEFERQSRVPNVNLNTSYTREYGREGFDVGLSVPAPLWYQRQGEIAGSLGAKRREEAELLRTRNELLRQVNQYFQDAQTTAKLIEVLEKGLLRQAEEALRIAKFSFQQGAASLLEVLDAQRVQRQTLFDYAQARFELSVALARLERAVGGLL
ncbi:MAG: putative Heavy metal efflux system, outer rane lipoprotein [Nitrospira sp.]|nr:putative Heavy metal efflux system, outer rane lipoprotein [Nitrospira sp.]